MFCGICRCRHLLQQRVPNSRVLRILDGSLHFDPYNVGRGVPFLSNLGVCILFLYIVLRGKFGFSGKGEHVGLCMGEHVGLCMN